VSVTAYSGHLQSLQILRAVAATTVVYHHTHLNPNFGVFGIDLFFVLSGLVISMVAESRASPVEFVSDRLTRIVPLYWLLTTAMLAIAAVEPGLLKSTTVNAGNYIKSIFFIPYFKENGSLTPVLPVGWTLNYEMLFYVFAAVSIATGAKKAFFVVTAVLLVAAWTLGHVLPPHLAVGELLRSDRLFEFILGMLAWKCTNLVLLRRLPALASLGFIAILYSLMAWCDATSVVRFPPLIVYGIPSLLIVLLTVRLESSLHYINDAVVTLLSHLGDASYATYLSHLFVIEFLRRLVVPHFPGIAPDGAAGAFVTVVACLMAGSAIYMLMDRQCVRYSRQWIKRHVGT